MWVTLVDTECCSVASPIANQSHASIVRILYACSSQSVCKSVSIMSILVIVVIKSGNDLTNVMLNLVNCSFGSCSSSGVHCAYIRNKNFTKSKLSMLLPYFLYKFNVHG